MRQLSDPLTMRAAVAADAEMILWLEEAAMKDYAVALWGDWRPSGNKTSIEISTHEMIERDGQVVGCVATRLDGKVLHLLRLYLAPTARNRGIGSAVLLRVLRRAASEARPVRLRVLVNNPAVNFYARHGFRYERQSGEHIYMIHDGTALDNEEPHENN